MTDTSIIGWAHLPFGKHADRAASQVLSRWAASGDDFHRLAALKGLLRIGDGRAMRIAWGMLRENHPPARCDVNGAGHTHVLTIRRLVWGMLLSEVSGGILRSLARGIGISSPTCPRSG